MCRKCHFDTENFKKIPPLLFGCFAPLLCPPPPPPKDDSCQVWLKFNHAFSRRRWKWKKIMDDARRTKTDCNRGSGELEMAKSNIHILGSKSSPNMREGLSIVRIEKKFEIPYECFQHPVNNWRHFRTPAYVWRTNFRA